MDDSSGGRVPSDALVCFGMTGDLAHKMIFPALYAMAKRDVLKVPVVGVASSQWNLGQLRERAQSRSGTGTTWPAFRSPWPRISGSKVERRFMRPRAVYGT
jgi:glucose-6-phosphate 1-dehydrogenase